MSPEYENLKGHSILIIESEILAGYITARFVVDSEISFVDWKETIPQNLYQYLEDNKIDIALIHTAQLSDKKEVLDAHQKGKTIVVIRRDPACTQEEIEMYKSFENEGIPTITKMDPGHLVNNCVELINKLLEVKS